MSRSLLLYLFRIVALTVAVASATTGAMVGGMTVTAVATREATMAATMTSLKAVTMTLREPGAASVMVAIPVTRATMASLKAEVAATDTG